MSRLACYYVSSRPVRQKLQREPNSTMVVESAHTDSQSEGKDRTENSGRVCPPVSSMRYAVLWPARDACPKSPGRIAHAGAPAGSRCSTWNLRTITHVQFKTILLISIYNNNASRTYTRPRFSASAYSVHRTVHELPKGRTLGSLNEQFYKWKIGILDRDTGEIHFKQRNLYVNHIHNTIILL